MTRPEGLERGQPPDAALVELAMQLRDAASRADRPDVVVKAQEIIVILGGREQKDDKGNAIIRMLDGLGL